MRILIVDDHELVRDGVRSILRNRPGLEVCGEAVDGHDAIEKARELNPDIIIMDISMPRLNGLDATREIRRILPQTAVVVLSQHDSPEMMRQALNAGARGYVVKSAIAANLISGINKVAGGQMFFDAAAVKLPEKTADKNLDVTEILRRSEAFEKALRESEERFRLTFEQAAVGIAHTSPDGHWLRVNQKVCEIVGYSQDELLKMTVQELTYPPDLPAGVANVQKALAGEIDQYSLEKRYVRRNGALMWIQLSVSAVRDADRNVKYFVGIVEDISARKDTETRLLASDERLRSLLDFQTAAMRNLAEGLYTLDGNGLVTAMNPAAEEMFGWTSAELLGKKMHDLTHYKHLDGSPFPASECPGLKVLQEGVPVREQEDFFIRKDGSFMPVVYSAAPLKRNGKTAGVVIAFRDDTEQRVVRYALQESERQLRETIDALPVAVYTTDAQGRLTHFNPAAVKFAAKEPELGTERWCADWKFYRPDGSLIPHRDCPMTVALRGGAVEDGTEIIAERPDGTKRCFRLYPRVRRDAAGNISGCVNMLADITERKAAEQASGLLGAIVDSSDDAIVSKTIEGVITSWNKSAERIFGYSASEAIGQNILMLVPPDRHQEEMGIRQRIARGERINHFETVRMHKSGTLLDLSLSISPIKDSSGHIVGVSNVSRDISERKRADRALTETARQQKALFRLADQLHRSLTIEEIFDSAMDAIVSALACDRVSILLADEAGQMHFVAWRGLAESYRKAVDGHSGWKPDERHPQPVCIEDVDYADLSVSLLSAVRAEAIQSLAFIPLLSDGKLMGKFMTYYDATHAFSEKEIDLSLTIARQLAFAIDRKRSEEGRRKSEAELASEADALAKLNQWNAKANLWTIRDLQEALDDLLGKAIELLGADKGNIQLLDGGAGVLRIAVQRGFDREFL
ncbi:MAG TPA: PAS domain S-box protein, partial [Candidatus Dormibacteraeota bacterium]|nr:PAS domain S-box protein [Candidatus Dormibacteraeota bacterium]